MIFQRKEKPLRYGRLEKENLALKKKIKEYKSKLAEVEQFKRDVSRKNVMLGELSLENTSLRKHIQGLERLIYHKDEVIRILTEDKKW